MKSSIFEICQTVRRGMENCQTHKHHTHNRVPLVSSHIISFFFFPHIISLTIVYLMVLVQKNNLRGKTTKVLCIFMKTRPSQEWKSVMLSSQTIRKQDWFNLTGNYICILIQALSLLKHLKSYRRISPPVDLEYQYMLEHVISLPPAAQTRLPFHLIFFGTAQNFWKILCMFLNL